MTLPGTYHLPLLDTRDADNPCDGFKRGKPQPRAQCDTDGHYMCDECEERKTCNGCGERPSRCECPEEDW